MRLDGIAVKLRRHLKSLRKTAGWQLDFNSKIKQAGKSYTILIKHIVIHRYQLVETYLRESYV